MRSGIVLTVVLLTLCGCQTTQHPFLNSHPVRPFHKVIHDSYHTVVNSLTYSRCQVVRKLPPGTRWRESDGHWVELGADGNTHLVPGPGDDGESPR